ncbi:hypothetical protein UMM65_08270 [Aureibaculum sp. 2210JD6-5]|uniref:hypothetical protein n=1 Tax=Aureibaculum sp. 2210JD6-5 TaxID=3103957 RepID=UPI002AAC5CB9|nr:hypothetical protein [Aureibaculum sp. 2210JD6-5]MDY7395235.1 hypothetical protein [Aureibaculum sp. 2210JD6-5]
MISEFRKSINAILFERVTSPLFGTFFATWMIWNWKIIYLTLFISESEIDQNKLEYITNNLWEFKLLVTYPIVSTIILITIIPFISNGAFWVSLNFKNWRSNQKLKIEKKQLISLEQAISLRRELREKEIDFEKILENKTKEITTLQSMIKEMEKTISEKDKELESITKPVRVKSNNSGSGSYSNSDFIKFKNNKKAFKYFENIAKSLRKKFKFPENLPEEIKEYYLINGIAEDDEYDDFENEQLYKLSWKGEHMFRDYFNENFDKN